MKGGYDIAANVSGAVSAGSFGLSFFDEHSAGILAICAALTFISHVVFRVLHYFMEKNREH